MHYWLRGSDADAPLVMLLHGAGIDHRAWAGQIDAFAARYRVLTPDIRGHGRSRPAGDFSFAQLVDDAFALLDAVHARDVILIGLSMGGNIAQEMAFRSPERFAALVCADCTCNTLVPWLDRATLPLYRALFGPVMAAYPRQRLLGEIARRTSLTSEGRRYVLEASAQMTGEETVRVMKALMGALHHEPGYRVTAPELLVHGSDDSLGNIRKVMRAWRARDPDCELAIIPAAGHVANMDNPDAFNQTVLGWLARAVR